MTLLRPATKLTHRGALRILEAAVAAADGMAVPQCVAIVDEGCNLLALARMDGSRLLSIASATAKAETAATTGVPTGGIPPDKVVTLAIATQGRMTNLTGGLPILVDGVVVGGIGVGSGTGEQDLAVARAALDAFAAMLAEERP